MTATDANRFVMRICRALTGRPRVLVFNGCYHGSLDETLVELRDGRPAKRGPVDVNPAWSVDAGVRVIEFNDVDALSEALGHGDVACVLAEPVMTNCGMVLPDGGYHEALRRLTGETGTYLVIDETHTWSTGYGGYTGEFGLEPDFLTIGKPIAGGIPIAAYGFTEEIGEAMNRSFSRLPVSGEMGIGGTLTANAFTIAAALANLSEVATREAFEHMVGLGAVMAGMLEEAIERAGLPWSVTRCGARAEIQFTPDSPRTGAEALAAFDWELTRFTHLYLMNRGFLITPFHNMMLVSPATTTSDVEHLVAQWRACMIDLARPT
jgi:glutamate-1-semialdehyde 2,1-aminomutase